MQDEEVKTEVSSNMVKPASGDTIAQTNSETMVSSPVVSKSQETVKKKHTILYVAIAVLTTSLLALAAYVFWPKQVDKTKIEIFPTPTAMVIQPTIINQTDNWNIFNNDEFSFKYPSEWQPRTDGKVIISSTPKVILWTFGSDDPMYNECMQLDDSEVIGNLLVKSYSRVTTVEACSGGDMSEREKWIVRADGRGFAPGIQYFYKNTESDNAEYYFDQIVATFKFVDASPSSLMVE